MEVTIYDANQELDVKVKRVFSDEEPGRIICPACVTDLAVVDVTSGGPCFVEKGTYLHYECECGFEGSGNEKEILTKEEDKKF